MAKGIWLMCATLALACTAVFSVADEPAATPTTQPAEVKPAKTRKLTEPWSFLKDLTPEQTSQIEKIHGDTADEIKKLNTKENDDITALLTPDQATELKAAVAKHKADEKEKMSHKKKEAAAATTEPAK